MLESRAGLAQDFETREGGRSQEPKSQDSFGVIQFGFLTLRPRTRHAARKRKANLKLHVTSKTHH
eukprot:3933780-Rhodomonas_salina.1